MFQTTNQVIDCLPYEPQLISIHRPFAILYPLFLAKQVPPGRVRSVDSAEDPAYAPALPRDRTRRGSHCLPGRSSGSETRTQGDGCHSMAGGQGNHLKRLDKAIQFG
jgi:hypothetical protein